MIYQRSFLAALCCLHAIAFKRYAFLITLFLSLATSAGAQRITDGATPLALSPGSPAGSYSLSGFDNVNLFNGNLSFRLPLLSVGGRGSLQYPLVLPLQRKWTVANVYIPETESYSYLPGEEWWSKRSLFNPGKIEGRYGGSGKRRCNDDSLNDVYLNSLTRLTFTAPDGTEIELRDHLSGGQAKVPVCGADTGSSRGRVFVSADGSAMTFVSDTEVNDKYKLSDYAEPFGLSGYLLLRDGTRYRFSNGSVVWVRDRNGNVLSFAYGTADGQLTWMRVTDSLNREVTVNYETDEITYKGFGGAERTIRLIYSNLSATLRAPNMIRKYEELFPSLEGDATLDFNPSVISSVVLPDGRSYTFKYNSWGELARVELPTGGAIEYDYAAGLRDNNEHGAVVLGDLVPSPAVQFNKQIYRRVVARRVYPNGGTQWESETTYSRPEANLSQSDGYVEVAERDSTGKLLSFQKHYFNGKAIDSLKQGFHTAVSYPAWDEGREYKTEWYDTDGQNPTTLVKRVEQTWQEGTPLSANPTAKVNARVVETKTTLLDVTPALVSKQTAISPVDGSIGFDQYNNPTDLWEYDFGQSTPMRHTQTAYVTSLGNTAYDALQFNETAPDIAATVHLRSLPARQSVYDANGMERARTTYEYDNYTDDALHKPLKPRENISGLDTVFANTTTPYIWRGNVTSVTSYEDAAALSGAVTTALQYDVAGSVVKAIDGRGKAVETDYASVYQYAFPTTVTSPIPAPSGQQGSSSAFVTTNNYDLWTGHVTSTVDANGQVMTYEYNDVLDRLKKVTRPDSGQTIYEYGDVVGNLHVQTRTQLDAARWLEATQYFDGLGRDVRSVQTEGTTTIISQQEYDALGRLRRSYNPYRTTSDETYGWAETTYDALSRVTRIESFTGTGSSTGAVVTAYSGNTVTVKDQAGKQRKSVTDALGRLVKVYEAPNDANLNFETSYTYDVLGNLRRVTHGHQTRHFMYDSFSRLIRAKNPEQTANAALNLTDSVTGNSQWSMSYAYDANGNLETRTDARNIKTTYTYDALNRVISRSYNDVPKTPTVSYHYDTVGIANGKGRLNFVLASLPTADPNKPEIISKSSYAGFDALGRVTSSSQQTNGQTYSMSYEYDLAGNLKSEIYPSGRIIQHTFDAAGRLEKVIGTRGNAVPVTYATVMSYAAHGAMQQLQLGNTLIEQTLFNSRLQPTDIKLGTATAPNSKLHLQYDYGTTQNNGNVRSQQIAIGSTLSLTQTYEYDDLNRLKSAREVNNLTPCLNAQGAVSDCWRQVYAYDPYGNRRLVGGEGQTTLPAVLDEVTNPSVSPATNRLTSAQHYGYDPAGNMTAGGGLEYVFDGENRIVTARDGNPQPNTYSYDGEGQRVKKVTNNGAVTTVFVYNALGQMVAEYTDGGLPTANETSYLTSDTLGTPRVIVKANGEIKSRHDYLPFGEEIFAGTGSRAPQQGYTTHGGADGVRQRFTSKERDDETGLDYFLARYYSSSQGRFTSPDEFKGGPDELFVLGSGDKEKQALPYADIASPQTLNKYQYCLNNPLRYIDPDGHQEEEPKKKGVIESIKDYLGSMIRSALKQGGQQEEDAWDNDDRPRGPAPVVINKGGLIERHADALRQGMEAVNQGTQIMDPTGAVGVLNAAVRGDKTDLAFSIAGMVINRGGGNVTFREAKRLLGGWASGTFKTISGSIKYHFSQHGAQVGAKNVGEYLRKAEAFSRNLRGARRSDLGNGRTRYMKNGYYVIKDSAGKIISYGRER